MSGSTFSNDSPVWKWLAGFLFGAVTFFIGAIGGDTLASYTLQQQIDTHRRQEGHPQQLVINAQVASRLNAVEQLAQRVIDRQDVIVDSLARIEERMGIERDRQQ